MNKGNLAQKENTAPNSNEEAWRHELDNKHSHGSESNHRHIEEHGHEHEHGSHEHDHHNHGHEHEHSSHGHDHDHGEVELKEILLLATGAVMFTAGMILEHLLSLPIYITLSVFVIAYILLGGTVVISAVKNILRGEFFDENFLMSIATIGAFIIGEYPEAVAVMLFYQVGELFQGLAVSKSKKSIADLMDIRPDFARKEKAGEDWVQVSPETVKIGDLILVKPGEKIPLDGTVVSGESMLDTKALTGESVPRKASVNVEVLSGCINETGVLTIRVTKTFGESTVSKIIDMVENASNKKAPTENFITKFSKVYTPAVVGLALLISVIPPLFLGGMWTDWINRGLIFLVISCPCALVISIPLGFFGGIGGASKMGILVKGGNYLEALGNLDIVVFDKTGTLTKGTFEVTMIHPATGYDEDSLMEAAACGETFSNHPIALSILRAHGKEPDKSKLTGYEEISGLGVKVIREGRTLLVGNAKLMSAHDIDFMENKNTGTKIYVAVDGAFAGSIVISDEIKPDSADAIMKLKSKGIRKTVMLTGDDPEIAKKIGEELSIDEVYGGLLPNQKVEMVETLNRQIKGKGKLAFIGDGINDAPVLARSDIGIAMGGLGSDAAIEAADVVLMTDELSKLPVAVDVAKLTKRIVLQNIFFALGIKGLFLLLAAFGFATMWEAVFADVGVALLAVLNAMRAIRG